jgi:hypothetical protein
MVSMVFRAIKWIGIFASLPCLLLLQQKASSLTGINSLSSLVQRFSYSNVDIRDIGSDNAGNSSNANSGNSDGGKSDGSTGDIAQATSLLQSNGLVKQALGSMLGNSQIPGVSSSDSKDAPKNNAKSTATSGSMTIMYHEDDQADGQPGKLVVKTLPPGAKVIFYKGRPQIYYPPKEK